jgi:hypothetical protein
LTYSPDLNKHNEDWNEEDDKVDFENIINETSSNKNGSG